MYLCNTPFERYLIMFSKRNIFTIKKQSNLIQANPKTINCYIKKARTKNTCFKIFINEVILKNELRYQNSF